MNTFKENCNNNVKERVKYKVIDRGKYSAFLKNPKNVTMLIKAKTVQKRKCLILRFHQSIYNS